MWYHGDITATLQAAACSLMGIVLLKKEVKKFPYVANLDELKVLSTTGGGFTSEEGASKMLGVPKSTLKQLEGRGDITGYRLKGSTPEKDHVFIDSQSVRDYQVRKEATTRAKAAAAADAKEAAAAKEAAKEPALAN